VDPACGRKGKRWAPVSHGGVLGGGGMPPPVLRRVEGVVRKGENCEPVSSRLLRVRGGGEGRATFGRQSLRAERWREKEGVRDVHARDRIPLGLQRAFLPICEKGTRMNVGKGEGRTSGGWPQFPGNAGLKRSPPEEEGRCRREGDINAGERKRRAPTVERTIGEPSKGPLKTWLARNSAMLAFGGFAHCWELTADVVWQSPQGLLTV